MTSDPRREGNVSARDRKLGPPVGWRLEVPLPGGPYASPFKADSKLEVVPLGCAHVNK